MGQPDRPGGRGKPGQAVLLLRLDPRGQDRTGIAQAKDRRGGGV